MKIAMAWLLCVVSVASMAQEHPAVTAQPNSIFVSADGRFEANPDTAVLQFNISAQEDNARAAYDRASKNTEQIREILRSNGVDPKSAEIGYFALQPVYDYKNPKRKLVGYRVETKISIKLKDFSKIGPITEGLADMDVTGNQSLSYMLDDMDAAKIKAVEDALHRAHEGASAVASASGRTLGELSYASVDTYEQPRPRPMPMAAMMSEMMAMRIAHTKS